MSFNANKVKVQLKLALQRLKLLQQKRRQANAEARQHIAQLLEGGKVESARVRVEHIIREDFHLEALEILELHCELLLARFGLLEYKHCDPSIAEAVNTVLYAAPRVEVKELLGVRDALISKFGKEFAFSAMENRHDVVNAKLVQKLRIQTPDALLVHSYLTEIANSFKIDWAADAEPPAVVTVDAQDLATAFQNQSYAYTAPHAPPPNAYPGAAYGAGYPPGYGMAYPAGYPVGYGQGYPQEYAGQPGDYAPHYGAPPASFAPPQAARSPEPAPVAKAAPEEAVAFPDVPAQAEAPEPRGADFDDLARRFEALKKKR